MRWMDRSLIDGPLMVLVTSQEEYDKACRSLGVLSEHWLGGNDSFDAHTATFTGNGLACIVSIKVTDRDPVAVASLLVHEAVHVWQGFEAACGEQGCFGKEGEAYFIQTLSQKLMMAYRDKL